MCNYHFSFGTPLQLATGPLAGGKVEFGQLTKIISDQAQSGAVSERPLKL